MGIAADNRKDDEAIRNTDQLPGFKLETATQEAHAQNTRERPVTSVSPRETITSQVTRKTSNLPESLWEVLESYQKESETYALNAQRWVSTAQSLNIENRDIKCSLKELEQSYSTLQDKYDKLWNRFSQTASALSEKDAILKDSREYISQLEKEKEHMSERIETLRVRYYYGVAFIFWCQQW